MTAISRDSAAQRRIATVVFLAVILWGYETAADLLYAYYQQTYFQALDGKYVYADMGTRWLQHFLLLPVFVSCYLLSLGLYQSTLRGSVKWLLQVIVGFGYSLSVRPLIFMAVAIVHGRASYYGGGDTASFWTLVSWPPFLWISSITSTLAVYFLGVFLFTTLFGRIDLAEERLRLARLSSEWLVIKLRTLQWQINPHFLFNSLNTVSALLRSSPSRADQVLSKFSDLLRLTLSEQENMYSSVSAELEYIHRYLDMEMVRFEDRLRLRVEADEDTLRARLPSLLLQPLIENAIKHGVARAPGPAALEVNVSRRGASLVMSVKNTTVLQPASHPSSSGMGLGMRNLRERLTTLYQDSFRFTCGQDGEGAWISTIEIPFTEHVSS